MRRVRNVRSGPFTKRNAQIREGCMCEYPVPGQYGNLVMATVRLRLVTNPGHADYVLGLRDPAHFGQLGCLAGRVWLVGTTNPPYYAEQ